MPRDPRCRPGARRSSELHRPSDLLRRLHAQVSLDQVERHVDAGGDPARGNDVSLVDDPHLARFYAIPIPLSGWLAYGVHWLLEPGATVSNHLWDAPGGIRTRVSWSKATDP